MANRVVFIFLLALDTVVATAGTDLCSRRLGLTDPANRTRPGRVGHDYVD